MDRVWESNAAATPTAVPPLLSHGYPTDGNLATSVPPTNPGAYWFHMITQELMAVIVAAGLTPDGSNLAQLLAALDARYATQGNALHNGDFSGSNQSLQGTGYQRLPGGLFFQWGSLYVGDFNSSASPTGSITFPVSFPATCFQVLTTFFDPTPGTGGRETSCVVTAASATGFSYSLHQQEDYAENATVIWYAVGN